LQKLDLEKVIAFPDFFPYCNEISTSNEIRLLPPQQIHVDDVAFLGFGFGFSVRVQSWSEKIQSSPDPQNYWKSSGWSSSHLPKVK